MSLDPEIDIAAGRQRRIKRNWRFFLLPAVVLCILLLMLAWELLRQLMNPYDWPWTITLLGLGPSATLVGIFASLLIAREQFARSMRPSLSWSCRILDNEHLGCRAVTIHLMNYGSGLAQIESVKYSFLTTTETGETLRHFLSRHETVRMLKEMGLNEDDDYFLTFIAPGAALPTVKKSDEGIEFAAFKLDALASVEMLKFSVTVVDIMGDRHQRSLPVMATLPENIQVSMFPRVIGQLCLTLEVI